MRTKRKECIKILNDLSIKGQLNDDEYFALMDFVVGTENETDTTYAYKLEDNNEDGNVRYVFTNGTKDVSLTSSFD